MRLLTDIGISSDVLLRRRRRLRRSTLLPSSSGPLRTWFLREQSRTRIITDLSWWTGWESCRWCSFQPRRRSAWTHGDRGRRCAIRTRTVICECDGTVASTSTRRGRFEFDCTCAGCRCPCPCRCRCRGLLPFQGSSCLALLFLLSLSEGRLTLSCEGLSFCANGFLFLLFGGGGW